MAPVDNERVEKLYNEMAAADQLKKPGLLEIPSPVDMVVRLVNANAKRAEAIVFTAEKLAKANGDDLEFSGGTKRRNQFTQFGGIPGEDVEKAMAYLENWREGQNKPKDKAPAAAPQQQEAPPQEEPTSKWRDTVAAQKTTSRGAGMGGVGG